MMAARVPRVPPRGEDEPDVFYDCHEAEHYDWSLQAAASNLLGHIAEDGCSCGYQPRAEAGQVSWVMSLVMLCRELGADNCQAMCQIFKYRSWMSNAHVCLTLVFGICLLSPELPTPD